MIKKLKVVNCFDCSNSFMMDFDSQLVCSHDKFHKSREIGNPLEVKAKNIIPDWCPLEEWEE